MPAYREPDAEVDEIRLPTQPECRVWMKRWCTRGDIFDAEEYVLETQRAGKHKDIGMSTNYRVALLQAITLGLITDWDLEDQGGEKWPFEFRSLRRLHGTDGAFLEREANKRIEGPGLPFDSTSQQPSKDTTSMTPTSSEPSSSTTGGEPEDGRPTSSAANGRATSRPSRSSTSIATN